MKISLLEEIDRSEIDSMLEECLTDDQLFNKNVIKLNNFKNYFFLNKINENNVLMLESLLDYFKKKQEFRYCSDIMRIFEMNKEIFS